MVRRSNNHLGNHLPSHLTCKSAMETVENSPAQNKPKNVLQPQRFDTPKWLRQKIRTEVHDNQKKTAQKTKKTPQEPWHFFPLREPIISLLQKNWEEEMVARSITINEPDEAVQLSRKEEKFEREEGGVSSCHCT